MSGLALFFRDHLLLKATAESVNQGNLGDKEGSNDASGHVGGESAVSAESWDRRRRVRPIYSTSIEETEPCTNGELGALSRGRRRRATGAPFIGASSSTVQGVTSWKEWRRICKRNLTQYIENRVLANRTAARSALDGGEGGNRGVGTDASFVNIRDTKHDVSYVADVSGSTRRLVSCSGVVSRVCAPRQTKRHSLRLTTRRRWTVDGPLTLGYSRVVSFEISQWLLGEENELRQRAQNCMNEKPKTRMMVFLYDGWADAFDSVMKRKPTPSSAGPPTTLLMRMENIPAVCIFPHGEVDWADNDMVPYCVCIGDFSPFIKESETTCLRFDDGVRLRFQHCPGWSQYPKAASATDAPPQARRLPLWTAVPGEAGVSVAEEETSVSPLFGSVVQKRSPAAEVVVPGNSADSNTAPVVDLPGPDRQPTPASYAAPSAVNRPSAEVSGSTSVERARTPNVPTARGNPSDRSPVGQGHNYYTLSQLREVLRRQVALRDTELVCLYAVVVGFGAPRRTTRGDWMMNAALVDDSFPSGDGDPELVTVNINMFNSDRNRLPDLHFAGDVVRIHRAKVAEYNGEIQLVGLKQTSYVVFRGNSDEVHRDDRWTVTAVARGFVLGSQEKEVFARTWRWGQHRLFSLPTLKVEHCTRICDMLQSHDTQSVEGDRDFTLMVCSIFAVPQHPRTTGVTPRGILRVWDGTGAPICDPVPELLSLTSDSIRSLVSSGEPPSICLERIAQTIKRISDLKNDFAVPAPRSLTGRVVNVAIWEDSHWDMFSETSTVKVGSFIRLRNVRESALHNTGIRCIHVSARSYLTPLPNLTFEVVSMLEEHDRRIRNGERVNPQSGVLSLQQHELPPGESINKNTATEDSSHGRLVEADIGLETAVPVVATQHQPESTAMSLLAGRSPMEDGTAEPDIQRSPKRPRSAGRGCKDLSDLLMAPVGSVFVGTFLICGTVPPVSTWDPSTLKRLVAEESHGEGPSAPKRIWRFAAALDDATARVHAISCDTAGEVIMGMKAAVAMENRPAAMFNLEKLIRAGKAVEGRVRSVEYQGFKYFLIDEVNVEVFGR